MKKIILIALLCFFVYPFESINYQAADKSIYNENYLFVLKPGGLDRSGQQRKSNSNYRAVVNSDNVGGTYHIATRLRTLNGVTKWSRALGDNAQTTVDNNIKSGEYVRLESKIADTSYVSVEAYGTWRSN